MYSRQVHPYAVQLVQGRLAQGRPVIRWLPFLAAAIISIGIAFLAPDGRKPFEVDCTLSIDAICWSLAKGRHVAASALVAVAAVLATGRHRLGLAFGLSVLVGAGWELGQTTVVGHNARWSDLAPDALGALLGCVWGAGMLWLLEPQPPRPGTLPWHAAV